MVGINVLIFAILFILANRQIVYVMKYFRFRKKGITLKAKLVNSASRGGWRTYQAKIRFLWEGKQVETFVDRPPFAWQPSKIGRYYDVIFLPEEPHKCQFRSLLPILTSLFGLIIVVVMASLIMLEKID